nr:MAG: hypothetical protein [Picornavirales sp.]
MNSKINKTTYLKNFFDIPAFLKVSRSFSRGELYREVSCIVLNYDSDWTLTMDNNTYVDVRYFKNLCKSLNIKNSIPKIDKYERNRKFVTHMFTTLSGGLNTRISTSLSKVDDLVDKFNKVVESSESDLSSILNNVKGITDFFAPTQYPFWQSLVSYVIKFTSFVYLLTKEQNRSVDSILALLVLILPISVGNCVISSLQRAIQGIITRFKVRQEMIAQDYSEDSTVLAFFKVTIDLFKSFFKDIPIDVFKNMSLSVSKIKLVADYLKNSNTIFEYMLSMFQKMFEIVGNKIMKYYGKLPKILQSDQLEDLIDRYVEIKEKRLDIQASNNSYIAKKLVNVYNDAIKIQAKLIKYNKKNDFGQSKILAYLNIIIRSLDPIIAKIPDHIKGTKNARRTKPFWLYIFGEPRIGKTAMLQPYIVNKIARECGLIDSYVDYSEYTYFRNCGDEYWEKYAGQPVLWYNDLFQVFTNENKVNVGIEELTNVVDDNLYPLNMAFEQKHNVYFDSQLVISNAQDDLVGQPFITNKCLSNGTHIYNRRNLVIRLRLNTKYKSYSGINYKVMADAKKNNEKFVGDLFPEDMYYIDFMEPATGQHIKTTSFNEAMTIIVNSFNFYKNHQNSFKDKLFNHFEQMWSQSNERWDSILQQISNRTFECKECEIIYETSQCLNQDERNSIKETLLLQCPHILQEKESRWFNFAETIKVNIKAFRESINQKLRGNGMYIILLLLATALPFILTYVIQYFKNKDPSFLSASHEGNILVGNKQNIRLVAQEYSQQNKDVEAKLRRNSVLVSLVLKGDNFSKKMVFGSGLGVGGDIFCMPKHFFDRINDFLKNFEKNSVIVEITFLGNQSYKILAKDIITLEVNFAHLADIIFLKFPKMCCLPKIDKFFVSSNDTPILYGSYLWGRRIDSPNVVQSIITSSVELNTRAYTHPEMELPFVGKYIPARKIVVPQGYEYNVSGVMVGDCGMVLLNVDDKMNCKKILGLHVAGTIKGNIGLSNAIFFEDIQEAYKQAGEFITMQSLDLLDVAQSNSVCREELENNFCVLGAAMYNDSYIKLSIPMKSKISKSVFFNYMEDEFGMNVTAPARLRPFVDDNGVKISPLINGLKKMKIVVEPFDQSIVNVVSDHIADSIINWKTPYMYKPRILTLEEAINGYGILNKLDITTSPGFPFQLVNRKGGKRDWIQYVNGNLVATSELVKIIEDRLCKAKDNVISNTFFVDTLKDETRDLDRVLKGKTRVFQVGPMCLSILMRQYFGFFIMHCQSSYISGEMAVGINANSYDWTLLLHRLMRVGNKFINGDYSDYDASMVQPVMMSIVESINKKYYVNATDEENRVRCVLFASFLNNVHIVEDVVFQRLQGNMSGIALTTIVNCLYNMFLMRYAYYNLVEKDLQLYNIRVSSTFYGDDNLVCVSDDIIHLLNMKTYADCMASFGIKYTSPNKTNDFEEYYSCNTISYLKRNFVKDNEYNYYHAQLDLETILEIPRWSESDPLNMVDQLNRFNCSLYESVHYGQNYYNFLRVIFVQMIVQAKNCGFVIDLTQLLSFDYILKSMYPQFFLCELTNCTDDNISMLQKSGSLSSDKNLSTLHSNDSDSVLYTTIANTNNNEIILTQSSEGNILPGKQQITRQMVAQDYTLRDYMDNINYSINFSKEFEFITMSAEEGENTGQTVTTSQITTSFDDNIPHKGHDSFNKVIDFNPFTEIDMDSFIKREWYLTTTNWSSTDARTSLFKISDLLKGLVPMIGKKIQNVAYWAPDIELIFRVNGTAMHYGRYLMCVVPSADILHEAYLAPQNASQYLFAQISPTGNQTVHLKVPWIHFYDRVPIDNSESTVPWRLYGVPIIPLTCANTATPAPVTIGTYIRITNPRFSGYTHLEPDWTTQSREQDILSQRENMTAQTTQEGFIKIVNSTADRIEKVAGDMSQLAIDAGFSNAPNLTSVKPVINRNILLNKVEDLPNTIILGPSQNQRVKVADELSNSRPDEMYISNIAGRMALLQTIKITSTIATGTNIFSFSINPNNLKYTDYEYTAPTGVIWPLPGAYLARLCRYWRGGLKLHFAFVSSGFHSMRVRFNYFPRSFTFAGEPNTGTSAFNVNQIWDVNTQNDYSVRIPWHCFTEWLPYNETSGFVYLTMLTKLTSVLTTPQPIYLQVWAGMDDDFQLAYPCIKNTGSTLTSTVKMYNPDVKDWVVQANEWFTQANEFNNGNPFINFRANQFPSMSSSGMAEIIYVSVGGSGEKRKDCRTHMSYEISSAKEFCNMLSPVEQSEVVAAADSKAGAIYSIGRKFIPYAWVDKPSNDSVWFNYFYQLMAIFRYARGSVRFAMQSNNMSYATVAMGDVASAWDGSFWQENNIDPVYGADPFMYLTSGSHIFSDLSTQPLDVTIPYYSSVKCLPTTYGTAKTWTMTPTHIDITMLATLVSKRDYTKNDIVGEVIWLVSGGDDLQLGYQIAVPRCRFAKPATAG